MVGSRPSSAYWKGMFKLLFSKGACAHNEHERDFQVLKMNSSVRTGSLNMHTVKQCGGSVQTSSVCLTVICSMRRSIKARPRPRRWSSGETHTSLGCTYR